MATSLKLTCPARLKQVPTNLLNNAAKYTKPGGRIGLTAEAQGRDLDHSQGGRGIGQALVRKLAEMHGGSAERV